MLFLQYAHLGHFVNVGVGVGTNFAVLRITELLNHRSQVLHEVPDDMNATEIEQDPETKRPDTNIEKTNLK